MMTYLCENCGSKFQSHSNWIDQPCQNIDGNELECGFPLAPILSLRIEGIEKEKEVVEVPGVVSTFDAWIMNPQNARFLKEDEPVCSYCGPDWECRCDKDTRSF